MRYYFTLKRRELEHNTHGSSGRTPALPLEQQAQGPVFTVMLPKKKKKPKKEMHYQVMSYILLNEVSERLHFPTVV
jgi:hypothetical protein